MNTTSTMTEGEMLEWANKHLLAFNTARVINTNATDNDDAYIMEWLDRRADRHLTYGNSLQECIQRASISESLSKRL